MPGVKDAGYWAARRAKQKQSLADSGRRKRPRGAAPANMRWDDVRGWVMKDDTPGTRVLFDARANAANARQCADQVRAQPRAPSCTL